MLISPIFQPHVLPLAEESEIREQLRKEGYRKEIDVQDAQCHRE